MKHTAVITYHRATCSCGEMRGVWRAESETVGNFTKRSYSLWEQHRDTAEMPVNLFDYRATSEPTVSAQQGLF